MIFIFITPSHNYWIQIVFVLVFQRTGLILQQDLIIVCTFLHNP